MVLQEDIVYKGPTTPCISHVGSVDGGRALLETFHEQVPLLNANSRVGWES
jgi:hypothetical protein